MTTVQDDADDRMAVLIVTSSIPGLLFRLFFSYLRMRRGAVKAERHLYRTMVKGGIPKHEARMLASEYYSITSITYWMKEMGPQARRGLRKN